MKAFGFTSKDAKAIAKTVAHVSRNRMALKAPVSSHRFAHLDNIYFRPWMKRITAASTTPTLVIEKGYCSVLGVWVEVAKAEYTPSAGHNWYCLERNVLTNVVSVVRKTGATPPDDEYPSEYHVLAYVRITGTAYKEWHRVHPGGLIVFAQRKPHAGAVWWPYAGALPEGYVEETSMRGMYPVGLDPEDEDYDVVGAGANTSGFTGFKYHGEDGDGGENNHEDHSFTHTHTFDMAPVGIDPGVLGTGPSYCSVIPSGTPGCGAEPAGGIAWCDTAPLARTHTKTDNRPPSFVGMWIRLRTADDPEP